MDWVDRLIHVGWCNQPLCTLWQYRKLKYSPKRHLKNVRRKKGVTNIRDEYEDV